MITQLGKDIYNAQHRILDHRVFVTGEIESFLQNFEVQRNEAEVETLFKVTEIVGELKYDLSDRCVTLGTVHLNEISNEVNALKNGIEDFLANVKEERTPSDFLVQSRRERQQRKENFYKDLEHDHKRVENSFEEKEEEIAELYSDLQHKLNIPK